MKRTFETDCKCGECGGTGLYVGLGEGSGAGVVCHHCEGIGKAHIKIVYEDFEGRVEHLKKIKRVYECNPGIGIGEGDGHTLEEFGGMPYEDWKNGKGFPQGSEMRKYTCPCWWYQMADYNKKPDWDECIGCGSLSGCKRFSNKDKCWERFDVEKDLIQKRRIKKVYNEI